MALSHLSGALLWRLQETNTATVMWRFPLKAHGLGEEGSLLACSTQSVAQEPAALASPGAGYQYRTSGHWSLCILTNSPGDLGTCHREAPARYRSCTCSTLCTLRAPREQARPVSVTLAQMPHSQGEMRHLSSGHFQKLFPEHLFHVTTWILIRGYASFPWFLEHTATNWEA